MRISPHDQGRPGQLATRSGRARPARPTIREGPARRGCPAGGKGVRRADVARPVTGLLILCGSVGLTVIAGLVHRSRDGRVRAGARDDSAGTRDDSAGTRDDSLRQVLDRLGQAPGARATLLQFSSAFCAPCRATRRILTEVSAMVDGVTHVEVDAEQQLELVRQLRIRKTPTTLILDGQARELQRATGQPRKADVLAALGQALR